KFLVTDTAAAVAAKPDSAVIRTGPSVTRPAVKVWKTIDRKRDPKSPRSAQLHGR
ncbi:MAG: hypothetical protein IM667_10365, partial [Phenylobacterium sp.]|nr:hypothetical protein [Phenylobacterium sp.]